LNIAGPKGGLRNPKEHHLDLLLRVDGGMFKYIKRRFAMYTNTRKYSSIKGE
jgi:hypothetical protein